MIPVLKDNFKKSLRKFSNVHRQSESKQNIFIFTTPRSGSTWLMELLNTAGKVKTCNEPFDLRNRFNSNLMRVNNWNDLYNGHRSNEICLKHINGFINGRFNYGYKNLIPFEHGYSLFTNKIIFKILHACEDKIENIRTEFNGKIILLLRHPIPVSLSRKALPRLSTFVSSDYRYNFSDEQLTLAEKIIDNGTFLEKAVLDWCFQNSVPLKNKKSDWIMITYEQLVQDPEMISAYLSQQIEDLNPKLFLYEIQRPSRTTLKSDLETQKKLNSNYYDPNWLINKWQQKVEYKEEEDLMSILEVFNIDVYKTGNVMPANNYVIKSKE